MRKLSYKSALCAVLCGFASLAFAQTDSIQSKKLPISALRKFSPRTMHLADPSFTAGRVKYAADGTKMSAATALATTGLPGVDTLTNWSDQFTEAGYDFNGNPQSIWPYTMVGTPPESGQTTTFLAPIIPVTVNLLGPDGTIAIFDGHPLTFAPTPAIVSAIVKSPVFQPWFYTSGAGQFNDQQMRSEFFNRLHGNSWHNLLAPVVRTPRTMNIPFGFWYFYIDNNNNPIAAAVDAGAFANLLYPPTSPVDSSTVIGAAEVSHDITTKDISSFAFNNVFIYQGVLSNCCILGFHDYDFEPGNGENGIQAHLFVFNVSSWISPGLFYFGLEDVTALSHEMSESFNDPFLNNQTPWYESIDPALGFALCQDNLETGDLIEVLTANPEFAISMNGRTYHPQNVGLFPWFAGESPSPAHLGAYSFPDETTITTLSPKNLLPGCIPAP